jgi:hypothetical protein
MDLRFFNPQSIYLSAIEYLKNGERIKKFEVQNFRRIFKIVTFLNI